MDFLFDTNILVGYVRGQGYAKYLNRRYQPQLAPNTARISIVSEGEILSLVYQFGWGEGKRAQLRSLLTALSSEEVKQGRIVELYAEIDAYSQGIHPTLTLPMSGRNMGKNDLWIAATATALGAKLVTTDDDFDHLNGVFLDVIRIDLSWTEDDA